MRIAHHDGRAVILLTDETAADVERASAGAFGPDPAEVYRRWPEFVAWAATAELSADVAVDRTKLGAPSPTPSQVVAIGLNYADHAAEAGFAAPTTLPPVFTKFPSAITGPYGEIALVEGGHNDWEVEVVAVIGREAHRIDEADAWSYVAGLTIGQDLSERAAQMSGPAPQFGLAKSFPGFAPMGPWLVTADELEAAGHDRDDLRLTCEIGSGETWETVQDGRTSKLIFPIARLVAELSNVLTLRPGDVIFTGTPDGVGMGMNPPRWLQPGETLRTRVEGLGEMQHTLR